MQSDLLADQQIVGLILIILGGALVFFWALPRMLDGLRYFVVGCLVALVGSFLLDWKISLLLWGSLAATFVLFLSREALYSKRFPVFSVPPFDTIQEQNGFTHHLHIREWKSHFIIGVDYECEVDGSVFRYQTRWKDRFPTHASAESLLRQRLAEWQRDDVMRGRL